MAGKTVAKAAKAVVKKVAVKKADVKKADVKKVAKPVAAVKKADGVKKPVAKKPNVGTKFNLHKLIMLIIPDAPKAKKGNKMMGGYKTTDPDIVNILNMIIAFLNKDATRERIKKRISEVYVSGLQTQDLINYSKEIIEQLTDSKFDQTSVKDFIKHIISNNIDKTLCNINVPDNYNSLTSIQKDKRTHNINFIYIVVELCNVYKRYNNNADNTTADMLINSV
jgi:hypothetical protein